MAGSSDARRTPVTSRGHKWISMSFLFNWAGGNVAVGGVECAMFHKGDKVVFEMKVKGASEIYHVEFFPDGTFTTKKL